MLSSADEFSELLVEAFWKETEKKIRLTHKTKETIMTI